MNIQNKHFSKIQNCFFIIGFICLLSSGIQGQPTHVFNSLKEIDACEGKITLDIIKIWGADDSDEKNEFFRFPEDIKVDKKGWVYILDSGNNRIQVFDGSGKYIRTIGRKGQGPGDMLSPNAIVLDNINNVVVADSGNRRVQAFDPAGNYLYSFNSGDGISSAIAVTRSNEIVIGSPSKSPRSRPVITLYKPNGTILKNLGKVHVAPNSKYGLETVFFSLDRDDNFFVSYYATPFYWKYSPNGKPLMVVAYDSPTGTPIIRPDKPKNGEPKLKITGPRNKMLSTGLTVDELGRVYLIVAKRPKKKSEQVYLVSDGPGTMRRYPQKIESEQTDRYRLLVFGKSGRVIASKNLSVFCDKLYVKGNTMFIIDSYMGMKIYSYKISFNQKQ